MWTQWNDEGNAAMPQPAGEERPFSFVLRSACPATQTHTHSEGDLIGAKLFLSRQAEPWCLHPGINSRCHGSHPLLSGWTAERLHKKAKEHSYQLYTDKLEEQCASWGTFLLQLQSCDIFRSWRLDVRPPVFLGIKTSVKKRFLVLSRLSFRKCLNNKLMMLFVWQLPSARVATVSKLPRQLFSARCPSWGNLGSNLQPPDYKTAALITN